MDSDPIAKPKWWHREAHFWMVAMGVLYLIFGVSMLLQGERWQRTPAYTDILNTAPTQTWGVVFTLVGGLMVAAVLRFPGLRTVGQGAVAVAMGLTFAWQAAFVLRWITSDNTTPYTWGYTTVGLIALIRSLYRLSSAEYGPR